MYAGLRKNSNVHGFLHSVYPCNTPYVPQSISFYICYVLHHFPSETRKERNRREGKDKEATLLFSVVLRLPRQREEKPPIFGHAYVAYIAERGGIFYMEPQWGGYPYRGSFPSILHWYYKRPPYTGESATLRFNDEWVKGGGWWLAGPRK